MDRLGSVKKKKGGKRSRVSSGVRESSFRHTFGTTRPEKLTFYNLKLATPNPRAIRANAESCVVPWSNGVGGFAYINLDKPGKQKDTFPFIPAHKTTVLSLDISNTDSAIVASGARESVIKIWDLSSHSEASPVTTPVKELSGHTSRVTGLNFNPFISHLLLSFSGDKTGKVWDLEAGQDKLQMTGFQGDLVCAEWGTDGSVLTSSKDCIMRHFDPRASSDASAEYPALHKSKKGFEVAWLGNDCERIVSVGWDMANREVALWDLKKMDQPLSRQVVDNSSSSLSPFYDDGTGLLFLVEKGTLTHYYEVSRAHPYLHKLSKYSSPTTHSASVMLPKRVNNVNKCEVARFLMVDDSRIEVTSFSVPRKHSTLFQEDLFPPVPSGESSQSLSSWFGGETKPILQKSLKPSGVKSVYEVSADAGGRSKLIDSQRREGKTKEEIDSAIRVQEAAPTTISQGPVEFYSRGWFWNGWVPSYLQVKPEALYCFPGPDSASPTHVLSFSNDFKEAIVSVSDSLNVQFVVNDVKSLSLLFKASSQTQRDLWISSLVAAQKANTSPPPAIAVSSPEEESVPVTFTGTRPFGYLEIFQPGYVYSSWRRNYLRVNDRDILDVTASETASSVLYEIHLDKVLAVYVNEYDLLTFTIATGARSWLLRSNTKSSTKEWVSQLEALRVHLQSLQLTAEGEKSNQIASVADVTQHYLSVKVGIFSWAKKKWAVSSGDTLLLYYSQSSLTPDLSFNAATLKAFIVDPTSSSPTFSIHSHDGTYYHFTAASVAERNAYHLWYTQATVVNQSNVDISEKLGIDLSLLSLSTRKLEGKLRGVLDLIDVKNGKQPVLVRTRGRRKLKSFIVPASASQLNDGNCFVLDCGRTIFQWNGKSAIKHNRAKALDVASKIRMKERGGTSAIVQLEQNIPHPKEGPFWEALGGRPASIPPRSLLPKEEDKESFVVSLYRVLDEAVNLVHEGKSPTHRMLQSESCYVCVRGGEMWTWIGRESDQDDRKLSYVVAIKLQEAIVGWTSWARVNEGGETILFKENFSDFPGDLMISVTRAPISANTTPKKEQKPISIPALLGLKAPTYSNFGDSDGGGVLKAWRIENYKKYPIEANGHLWEGDSFLFLYQHRLGYQSLSVLYFWQGRKSSINEKGTAAYLTKELDDLLHGQGKQVRVLQLQERPHFLSTLPPTGLIIHKGNYNEELLKDGQTHVFEVREEGETASLRTLEVELSSTTLNANHSFIIVTATTVYTWRGQWSRASEVEHTLLVAQSFSDSLGVPQENLAQKDSVSHLFPGLLVDIYTKKRSFPRDIRMFEVSNASGIVEVVKIPDVRQSLLNPRKVMIVDDGFGVWVWFGPGSKIIEQKWGLMTAVKYADFAPHLLSHQKKSGGPVPITLTYAYKEPREFTVLFFGFTEALFPRGVRAGEVIEEDGREALESYHKKSFTFAELTAPTLPKAVDPLNKEIYLSDAEFSSHFKMSKEEYERLPKWKRVTVKKSAGLY